MATLFERRVLGLLVEELDEGIVQVPQGLLHGDARNFAQPRGFFFAFPLSEFGGSMVVTNPFLPLLPSISSISQRPVIGVAATTEYFGKLCLLGLGWVKPKLVSNFHTNNLYV